MATGVIPEPYDVADFLGKPEDPTTLTRAQAQLPFVTATVRAYTRDRGFDDVGNMDRAIALVVVASTARLVGNPEHNIERSVGAFSEKAAIFNGWTLPELAVLHRSRKRAQ